MEAPGSVKFRAGMKELTGPAMVQSPSLHLPAGSLAFPNKFSARLDIYDHFIQHQFKNVSYRVKLADGRAITGFLDEHGRTPQIYAESSTSMEALAGISKPEWDLIFDHKDADSLNKNQEY